MYSPQEIEKEYIRWCEMATEADLKEELESVEGDAGGIEDRFYRDLEFGTGGLRGVIGAGLNRMNVYTVARATQGLSKYLCTAFENPSVAIAYDSRIKSDLFARTAAEVFCANGVRVHIYRELMPTPSLSFAVRRLSCSGGIVITASHNPSKYNGYKVYGADGCQITLDAAAKVLAQIEELDVFDGIKRTAFDEGLQSGAISYIDESVFEDYMKNVTAQGIRLGEIEKDVSIVYTPLNGSGLRCVTTALRRNGFTNITVVPEQEKPDGHFPTCPYPNPEIREALEKGLECAKRTGSDLLLATDPDCDRIGIAVRDGEEYRLLAGNQTGVLLLDYIAKSRIEKGTMPERPIAIKTIVTTEMAGKIAAKYGIELINVLTGFKFIGEQIGYLEAKGEDGRYIFGFEESYGYLSGSYVRDKDGVDAALLICEMFAYYKGKGLSLLQVLDGLYKEHGYFVNTLKSYTFEGSEGFSTMQGIMTAMRRSPIAEAAGRALVCRSDYDSSVSVYADGHGEKIELPKSDVLKFDYEGDISVVVRPSGTEPKLKLYYSVKANSLEEADELTNAIFTVYDAAVKAH